jgi:hypothetical protein
MLWFYGDESGEHNAAGSLVRLTLAGGIATCEDWKRLTADWKCHLGRFAHYGISWFHMTDFEAHRPPFDKLTDVDRFDLLQGLLDITLRHVPLFFGTTDEPSFDKIWLRYGCHVLKTQRELTIAARRAGEKITMVLAKNHDVKAGRLRQFVDGWIDREVFEFGGFECPQSVCPLQVADIVAYEFSRTMRQQKPGRERYPLSRLKAAQGGCHLLSLHFLKRMEI